jgi:hypothetical protein
LDCAVVDGLSPESSQAPTQADTTNRAPLVKTASALRASACGIATVCGSFSLTSWLWPLSGQSTEGTVQIESGTGTDDDGVPVARQPYAWIESGCIRLSGAAEVFAGVFEPSGDTALLELRQAHGVVLGHAVEGKSLRVSGHLSGSLTRFPEGVVTALDGVEAFQADDGPQVVAVKPVGLDIRWIAGAGVAFAGLVGFAGLVLRRSAWNVRRLSNQAGDLVLAGRRDDARRLLERAARRRPSDPNVALGRAFLARAGRDFAAALDCHEAVHEQTGGDALLAVANAVEAAYTAYEAGRVETARLWVRRLRRFDRLQAAAVEIDLHLEAPAGYA